MASFVAMITLVSGVLFLVLAVLKMGWIAQFLSRAVVTGFLFGAAIDVVIGELPKLTGTKVTGSNPICGASQPASLRAGCRAAAPTRSRSSAATAGTIQTWTTARSHPSFSGSAGRTRSWRAWRHIRSTSTFTTRGLLLPLRLFRNKIANLGLGTQTIQWLILQGSFFTVSVYLQEVNGYSAIQTGLMLTPATLGILAASAGADRFARRHPQRWLIIAGFLATAAGMILLLALVRAHSGIWTWIPGLLLFGAGVGVMLTSSVNVVQSSFPDADQGEISGLSRSVSNLGSSLGTALVGSVLVAVALPKGQPFAVALAILLVIALIGLVLAVLIRRQPIQACESADSAAGPATRPSAP